MKAAGQRSLGAVNVAQMTGFDEVIDVRSPAEFAEDHIPGAINCPVLNDAERAQIGTLFKQVSPFEAKKVGAMLVSRNISEHIDARFLSKGRQWRPLIYCWRGGTRSAAMTQIFQQIGWQASQLQGGYKAYRRHVIDELALLPARFDFRVLCGLTGSGKSRLIEALHSIGAQALDLEKLAAHRGSVLGNLPDQPQPSQKMFESRLCAELLRMDTTRPVFVEAESRKIGSVRVPETLIGQMWGSTCIRLGMSLPARVRLLREDYRHYIEAPERLMEKLDHLRRLYSREKIAGWKAMAGAGQWETLISELLSEHYDPAYNRSTLAHYEGLASARVLHGGNDSSFEHLHRLAISLREESLTASTAKQDAVSPDTYPPP